MLRSLFSRTQPQSQEHEAAVEKLSRDAESNRRLAMYDRDTGLYAYWYILKRVDEEAKRAERYGHPFSLILISVDQGENFGTLDKVTEWLNGRLRSTDFATHLGDGRYLAVLPETASSDAQVSADRLKAHFSASASVGVSSFPEDGTSLLQLLAVVEQRISGPRLFGLERLSIFENTPAAAV